MQIDFEMKEEMLLRADLLITMALEEDLSTLGDVTSESIFGDDRGSFTLFSKDTGIFCGKEIIEKVFASIDKQLELNFFYQDGDQLKSGDKIMTVSGLVCSILKAERTAINFSGFLSGMATASSILAKKAPSGLTILDTRKTLPGYRLLSKYAVKCGKADNHRIGLYDMVMIKDNHIDAAGSISNAVAKVRKKWGDRFKIEVETRDIAEIEEALECQVDRIMLDNMSDSDMTKAVLLIAARAETEASGNMSVERLPGAAQSGVDFVSFGSITHSVRTFDFSLKQD